MSIKDAYKLDAELAFDKGFRIDFYDDLGNEIGFINIRYAGPSNKKFTAFRSAFMKPYERKVASGSRSEAESDKLTQEVFVKGGIIAAWGEDQEITVESFREMMQAAPPETWRDIYTTAYNAKYYAAVSKEAETGN